MSLAALTAFHRDLELSGLKFLLTFDFCLNKMLLDLIVQILYAGLVSKESIFPLKLSMSVFVSHFVSFEGNSLGI